LNSEEVIVYMFLADYLAVKLILNIFSRLIEAK